MKRGYALTALILCATSIAYCDELPIHSPIESIALFKNGLAVVRRSIDFPGPGAYRLDDVIEPVHGTFWIEGDMPVDAQVAMREVDAPAAASVDFQQELVGRQVTIHFKTAGIPVASGKVVALGRATGSAAWDREYQPNPYGNYYGTYQSAPGPYLVLETDGGRQYVSISEIGFVDSDSTSSTTRQRVPVILLTPHGDKKGTARISYLTKGIAWAPSYRINLADDKNLTVEQQAVIKNELADFKDADLRVISGFPNIQFAHVLSPLALSQNWANFFVQMNGSPEEFAGAMSNLRAAAQSAQPSSPVTGIDLSATPEGENVDIHYQSIGKRTMNEGDSLMVSVAQAQSPYDRIVEWIVPDTRDVDGHFTQPEENRRNEPTDQDQAWDSIRFRNPLPFAMTTAPAMIEDSGHFAGQQLSYWVNTGEQTTLHVTKALSIRTRATEQEEQNAERSTLYIGGREFRKVNVKGTLTISNHRNHDVPLIIRRQFSGDLTKADENPKQELREEGVYSVNRRNELTWDLTLKAGEEKTLTYEYSVLIAD
jgi:hypothetical protein